MCERPTSVDETRLSAAADGDELATGDELAWEALSHEAMLAHQNGRCNDAIILWRRAASLTQHFAADDPRRAATLSNLATADALSDQLERAEEGFRAAGRAWEAARSWTMNMAVTGTARSSLFHHRLEMKHRDQYKSHLRSRFCQSIDAGDAASAFNHGVVLTCLDHEEGGRQRIATAIELRRRAVGAADPGHVIMTRTLAALDGTGETAGPQLEHGESTARPGTPDALQRWAQARPPQLNDERRLISAVCLTAILNQRDFM